MVSAADRIRGVVGTLQNWTLESGSETEFHLTRKTGTFKFIDDVKLSLTVKGDSVVIHADSRSRVGVGDFGQNRRNILELFAALRTNR